MRHSRATLQKATVSLEEEVEARIMEGFVAHVLRYFSDRELRKRLVLAKAAASALRQEVNR